MTDISSLSVFAAISLYVVGMTYWFWKKPPAVLAFAPPTPEPGPAPTPKAMSVPPEPPRIKNPRRPRQGCAVCGVPVALRTHDGKILCPAHKLSV